MWQQMCHSVAANTIFFGKVEVILFFCRSATGFGLFPALLFCLWLSGSIVHGWPEIHSSPISLVDLSGGLLMLRVASSGERNTILFATSGSLG